MLLHTDRCRQHTRETVVILTIIEKIYYQNRGAAHPPTNIILYSNFHYEFNQGFGPAGLEVPHPLCLEATGVVQSFSQRATKNQGFHTFLV